MFWGLVLEPSKKYTQKVAQTFHISQAALDLKSSDLEPTQLVVEYENSNFVLATLSKKANIFQVPLDLIFKAGDQVSFRTIGNGKVHLSGYHVLDDLDSVLNGEDESDYEDIKTEDVNKKRKKTISKGKGNKKARLNKINEGESDESEVDENLYLQDLNEDENDDENDDDDDELENEKFMIEDSDDDDDDDDDDADDDDDDDDDDGDNDDDSDDEKFMIEDSGDDEEDDDDDDDDDVDDNNDEGEEEYDLEFGPDDDPDDLSDEEEMKLKKSDKKKMLNGNVIEGKVKNKSAQKLNQSQGENKKGTPKKDLKTPKSEKKNERQNKSSAENTPKKKGFDDKKGGDKTPKSSKSEAAGEKRVLEGGIVVEEVKVGTGAVAKPGKMVNVYYVGSLQSTKKQFDSVQHGPGFKFILGKNEVIKGWDIGLNGMKVGGIRKLTIPPYLAYGAKGSPPVIPPNSTLLFTVELRSMS